jgi:hypothetical protein
MELVYATASTTITDDYGQSFTLQRGEVWQASDPLVLSRPMFFSKNPVIARTSQGAGVVEVATAVPGEKRKTNR